MRCSTTPMDGIRRILAIAMIMQQLTPPTDGKRRDLEPDRSLDERDTARQSGILGDPRGAAA